MISWHFGAAIRLPLLPFLCFFLGGLPTLAQDTTQKKAEKIELLHANSLKFDRSASRSAQRLIGKVRFRHKGAIMNCDSAYLYKGENRLDAFSNVHIEQGDTLDLYSDSLKYNGNNRKARAWGNIKMEDKDMTLFTDTLQYDMKAKKAFYQGGGKILNKEDDHVLTSRQGYYDTRSEQLFFRRKVVLDHPDYILRSDTLNYVPNSGVATITGPTTVEMEGGDLLYCENGWYDTRKERSRFYRNAYIISDERKLSGDSMLYDQEETIGRVFGNVAIRDTSEKLLITGEKGYHDGKREFNYVTGNALLRQGYEKEQDSLFLRADTLLSYTDTTTDLRTLKAYFDVRFFRSDIQGKCDSLVYNESDSLFKLFRNPILWSDKNQMSGKYIELKAYDGELHKMWFEEAGFIISKADTQQFNQIKGKRIIGHFRDNELHRVFVEGNGETIYYAREEQKKNAENGKADSTTTVQTIGVNEAECSNILIILEDNEIKKLTFLTQPSATLHPINKVTPQQMVLEGFFWAGPDRPKKATVIRGKSLLQGEDQSKKTSGK